MAINLTCVIHNIVYYDKVKNYEFSFGLESLPQVLQVLDGDEGDVDSELGHGVTDQVVDGAVELKMKIGFQLDKMPFETKLFSV